MHDIIGREKSYSLYGNGDNGSPAINIFMLLFCSATWYASLLGEPPALDSVQFGWEADPVNKCLIPQNMRKGTPYAPLHVLQLVRCVSITGKTKKEMFSEIDKNITYFDKLKHEI